MIHLIGGSPRIGKTNPVEALDGKTSFPYFSLDHVTSVITPYIPEQEYETKLPLFMARLRKETVDVFYAKYSAEQIVDFYLRQAETYRAGIMISRFGRHIEKEAGSCNFHTINTDIDLKQKIKESLNYLSL